jgi:peptidoglycan hydrolase-like protein with peptidoglycan-binding domain
MGSNAAYETVAQRPGKRRADAGFLSLVVAVSAVSGTLIFSMSANDPYWRLFHTASLPAPAYETPSDMRAVMAVTLPEFANPETSAASPDAAASLDRAMTANAADTAITPEPALARVPVPVLEDAGSEPALVVASAPAEMDWQSAMAMTAGFTPPPPLMPVTGRHADPFGQPIADLALTPFAEPAAPAQPRIAATEMTEETLALRRAQRIDVQRRLALAGFDPRGFDGVFGPNTRSAIADFQQTWGYPSTGYLEDSVYVELNQRTEDAYLAMRQRAANAPGAAPVLASAEPAARPGRDGGQCARRSDGRIIERQSLACDMAGFAEQFVSLGRTSIDDADEPVQTVAAIAAPRPAPGVDR